MKHDGYRALLIKDGDRISLQTRKGNDLLHFFPEIAADLRKLPDIALDGELVMLDANGKPEFHQLRGRCAMRDPQRIGVAASAKPAAVFAFDVLQLRGKDLRALPLLKRKAALQKELSRTERIVYCQHIGESGEKLFQAAHGSDVTVLDFEMFRYGSVWADVTYFLHQLQTLLLKPTFRPRVVAEAATAFLAGYGVGLAEDSISIG